jgi:nucleotide-binding universal stress UspA family protein
MGEPGRIVVGVDGSDESRDALRFAAEEAVRRGARLVVVWAFPWPESRPAARGVAGPHTPEQVTAELESRARRMVDRVPGARPPAVDVVALIGSPGRVLVEQADGAELLVVGHRGRGAVASAVLGSVALHCALHAPGAVAVVRPARVTVPAAQPAEVAVVPA